MTTSPHHLRFRRPLWAVVCLAAVASVALGVSVASATTSRTASRQKVVVLSTSPAAPTAGQSFTQTFSLMKRGVPQHMQSVACFAMSGRQVIPLTEQVDDGTVGHCTWALPATPKGTTFDGIIAVKDDSGVENYYGFDLPISSS